MYNVHFSFYPLFVFLVNQQECLVLPCARSASLLRIVLGEGRWDSLWSHSRDPMCKE